MPISEGKKCMENFGKISQTLGTVLHKKNHFYVMPKDFPEALHGMFFFENQQT